MRAWGLVCVLAVSACYRGASELPACSIRCDQGCPSDMTCSNGYCTKGNTCSGDTDAGPTCGELGQACCGGDPACASNGMCVAGVCQPGCITDISPGRRFTCALRHDNTVWCSGNNDNAELGNGTFGGGSLATFAQATDATGPIADATAIGAGSYHACAVRAGGHVSCWGYNGYGELGNNSNNNSATAVDVMKTTLEPLANIVEVHSGSEFTCGLDATGGVWCWGRNNHGQLGDGSLFDRATAAQVLDAGVAFTGTKQLEVGRDFACLIDASSQLWCWGRNDYDNLGDGNETDSAVPVHTIDATAVALHGWGGCALISDGTVKCWGAGWQDRIGDGAQTGRSMPVQVLVAPATPLTGVIGIAGGGLACALTSDHRALCWGHNPHGQTGNGAGSMYPQPVTNGGNFSRLVAHYSHVCGFGLDGSLRCWGRNTEGELGNATFDNVPTPEPIAAICH